MPPFTISQETKHQPSYYIGKLAEPVVAVHPDTQVFKIEALVGEKDPINAVVVVDAGRPVGLVMSLHLHRTLSHQFGLALFADQPVSTIMDQAPMIVPMETLVEEAASAAMSRDKNHIYDHIIITENGRLTGIVSVWKMLDHLSRLHMRRTRELTHINRQLEQGIRQRKTAVRALRLAKDEAERANRAKSEFLARMSHEIRTPMNAILGMAELLLETPLNAEQKEYVRTFSTSGELLLGVINDILDFSKIEAEQVILETIPFDLRELVADTVRIMDFNARQKGLELTCRIDGHINTARLGDPTRLRQVLLNLLSNAVKFTHQGRVTLKVAPDPGHKNRLHFMVKDTGIGIPEEKQQSIFESFTQADTSTTREYGGTGLGLAICQRLVALMGGKLKLKSRIGQGAEFHFSIRLEKGVPVLSDHAAVPVSDGRPVNTLPPIKVLLAEDYAPNAKIVSLFLKNTQVEIDQAANGQQALEFYCTKPYDLVLMDMEMPVMDGLEATRRIRDWETENKRPPAPILALTAHVMEEHRQRCLQAGCSAFLHKPVRKKDLIDALIRFAPAMDPEKEPVESVSVSPIPDNGAASDYTAYVDEELADFIDDYIRMVMDDCRQLTGAIKEKDFEQIYDLAHNLKGSGAGYGLEFVTECGTDICALVPERKLQSIWRTTKQLFDYIKRVKVVVQSPPDAPVPETERALRTASEIRRASNH